MRYKRAEGMDQEVSAVGFGTWSISGQWSRTDDREAVRAVHAAADGGVNLFDTAPIYGFGHSEEVLGRALKEMGGRDRLFIASKAGLRWNGKGKVRNDLSRGSLCQEIDEILGRLGSDYLDLWQIHWPAEKVPLEETLGTMEEIRQKGKVRYLGVCNFSLERLGRAEELAPVASYQGLYNMLEQNADHYHSIDLEYRTRREILPHTGAAGQMFLPYSPLMQGLLTGSWAEGSLPFERGGSGRAEDVRAESPEFQPERLGGHLAKVEELKGVAADLGWPMVHLALAWLTDQPEVTSVIAGGRTAEHARSNAAGGELVLPGDARERVEEILGR